jgi:hypothetical protein
LAGMPLSFLSIARTARACQRRIAEARSLS